MTTFKIRTKRLLPALLVALSLTACNSGLSLTSVGSAVSPASFPGAPTPTGNLSGNDDITAQFLSMIPKKPYTGPVRIAIDTGLLKAAGAKRQVFSLSNKHNDAGNHTDEPQGRYFDPDQLPTTLNTHLGDQVLEPTLGHLSAVALNGETIEMLSDVIQIRFTDDGTLAFEQFKQEFNPTVLNNVDGTMYLRLDLTKIKVSELSKMLAAYNQVSPTPITDVAFSSLAAAQTATALFNINMRYGRYIRYALPARLPHSPYIAEAPENAGVSKSVEGKDRNGPVRGDNVKWLKTMRVPQSRVFTSGYGAKIAHIDGGYYPNGIQDIRPARLEKKNFHARTGPNEPSYTADFGMPAAHLLNMSFKQRFHGSYALAVEGAGDDDEFGSVGVAPKANLLQLRSILPTEHVDAVKYAISRGASVVIIDQDLQLSMVERHYGWTAAASFLGALGCLTGGVIGGVIGGIGGGVIGGVPGAGIGVVAGGVAGCTYGAGAGSSVTLTRNELSYKVAGAYQEAAQLAVNANIPFVAPAGNNGEVIHQLDDVSKLMDPSVTFTLPASLPEAITVGGYDVSSFDSNGDAIRPRPDRWDNGSKGSASNYGPAVDIYAPANEQFVTAVHWDPDRHDPDQTADYGGTSGASPAVAGVIGLMKSIDPTLNVAQIRASLEGSAYRYKVQAPDGTEAPAVDAFMATDSLNNVRRKQERAVEINGRITMQGGRPVLIRDDVCGASPVVLEPAWAVQPYVIPLDKVPRDTTFIPSFPQVTEPAISFSATEPPVRIWGWFDLHDGNKFEVASVRSVNPVGRSVATCYRVTGGVTDAVTGGGVPGVDVYLRGGAEACDGAVVSQTQTGSDGQYVFSDVAEGNYTVTIARTGYVRVCSNVSVNASNPAGSTGTNVVTSTSLPSNATRFVLVWGQNPLDLDSHLTGPAVDGGRFHVYWNSRTYSDNRTNVNLDRDDLDSYGPETITNTVYSTQQGTFRYAVHDYSNRDATGISALANSGATVLVFRGSQLVATVKPPAGQPGTVWNVLDMDGGTGAVTVVNRMGYASDPSYVVQSQERASDEIGRLIRRAPPKH